MKTPKKKEVGMLARLKAAEDGANDQVATWKDLRDPAWRIGQILSFICRTQMVTAYESRKPKKERNT